MTKINICAACVIAVLLSTSVKGSAQEWANAVAIRPGQLVDGQGRPAYVPTEVLLLPEVVGRGTSARDLVSAASEQQQGPAVPRRNRSQKRSRRKLIVFGAIVLTAVALTIVYATQRD